jgi:four helix bundle protein
MKKHILYLERIKFCYNGRASLIECNDHWIELLKERGKVNNEKYKQFKLTAKKLSLKLNNFIASLYKLKSNEYP